MLENTVHKLNYSNYIWYNIPNQQTTQAMQFFHKHHKIVSAFEIMNHCILPKFITGFMAIC